MYFMWENYIINTQVSTPLSAGSAPKKTCGRTEDRADASASSLGALTSAWTGESTNHPPQRTRNPEITAGSIFGLKP